MKSSFAKFSLVLAALLLCLSMLSTAALAEEAPTVQINAQVTLEGTLPSTPESYILRMSADNASNPMPDGQTGGRYDLTITGAGTADFPAMTFEKVGIYTYSISQLAGENEHCTYDERSYKLTVSVVNAENGGLAAVVAMYQADVAEKKESTALFHNVYETIVKPTTPPGTITETGVRDMWMYYAGGSVLLLIGAAVIVYLLRKPEESSSDGE